MNTQAIWRRLGLTVGGAALVWSAGCARPDDAPLVVAGSPPVSSEVADIDITTNVRMALQQDDSVKDFTIEVHTTKGDVRLTGVVDTQVQADQVDRLARAATGVHAIHNEVTVRP